MVIDHTAGAEHCDSQGTQTEIMESFEAEGDEKRGQQVRGSQL